MPHRLSGAYAKLVKLPDEAVFHMSHSQSLKLKPSVSALALTARLIVSLAPSVARRAARHRHPQPLTVFRATVRTAREKSGFKAGSSQQEKSGPERG
jgi:hypothetical protein